MSQALAELILTQATNWEMVHGGHVNAEPENVRWVFLALVDEAMELAKELGWKPWKPGQVHDRAKLLDEWADLFAFFGSATAVVMSAANVGPEELAAAYRAKTERTHARFSGHEDGYTKTATTQEEAVKMLDDWITQNPALAEFLIRKGTELEEAEDSVVKVEHKH